MRKLDINLTKNSIQEILNLVKSSDISQEEKESIKQEILAKLEVMELQSEEAIEIFCDAHELLENII
jgi:hypothetical protein